MARSRLDQFMQYSAYTAFLGIVFSLSFAVSSGAQTVIVDGEVTFDAATLNKARIWQQPDDGTYKTIDVTSSEACDTLCRNDKACRGAITYQADITKPEMQCRLNNGMSPRSPFEVKPPEPLLRAVAVADLNAYRAENGLGPVTLNEKLNKASEVHAKDLAKHGNAAHEGSDGSTHGERVQRQAYYYSIAAENVATGQKSWDAVFKAWQESPGHNRNLLDPDVTEFGIALIYEPTTTYANYWAMLVAAPLENFVHPTGAMTAEQARILKIAPTNAELIK